MTATVVLGEPLWYVAVFALVAVLVIVGVAAAGYVIGCAIQDSLSRRDRATWSRMPGGLS